MKLLPPWEWYIVEVSDVWSVDEFVALLQDVDDLHCEQNGLLTKRQIQLAADLWFSQNEIFEMENRKKMALSILRELEDDNTVINFLEILCWEIIKSTFRFEWKVFFRKTRLAIEQLLRHLHIQPKINNLEPSDEEISWLIASIFSSYSLEQNLPYIAPYYSNDPTRITRYSYMLALLDVWRNLWQQHKFYGGIPSTPSDYGNCAEIFWRYTFNHNHFLYVVPYTLKDNDSDNLLHVQVKAWEEWNWLPVNKTFLRVTREFKKWEWFTEEDIACCREVFIVGSEYMRGEVNSKIRSAFFGRYGDIIERYPEFCRIPQEQSLLREYQTLKLKREQKKESENRKPKSKPKGSLNPKIVWARRIENTQSASVVPIFVSKWVESIIDRPKMLPAPKLSNACISKLRNASAEIVFSALEFCENLGNYVFWVGKKQGWEISWKQFQRDKAIVFPFNEWKQEYIFCFSESSELASPLDASIAPRTEQAFVQKWGKVKSYGVIEGVQAVVKNTTAPLLKNISVHSNQIQKNTQETIQEERALAILDALNNGYFSYISWWEKGRDELVFTVALMDIPPESCRISFEKSTRTLAISWFDQSQGARILEILWDDPLFIFEKHISNELQIEHSRILFKLSAFEDILYERFSTLVNHQDIGDASSILTSCRIRDAFAWVYLTSKKCESILELFCKNSMEWQGVSVRVETPDQSSLTWKKELIVSISLKGESHVAGKIVSLPNGTGFALSIDPKIDVTIRDTLKWVLVMSLMVLGTAGKKLFENQLSPASSQPPRKKWQETFNDSEIADILTWTYRRHVQTWTSLRKTEQDLIYGALRRLDECDGRQCLYEWFDRSQGYYVCKIVWGKWWADLKISDKVVVRDEIISSVPEGKTGHSGIYMLIQKNPRLKKYLILRMVATILGSNYHEKAPFTNEIQVCFVNFWNALSREKQKEFLQAVTTKDWSAGKWLEIQLTDAPNSMKLFDAFIEKMERESVPLIYSRPMILTVSDLLAYRKMSENITYTR